MCLVPLLGFHCYSIDLALQPSSIRFQNCDLKQELYILSDTYYDTKYQGCVLSGTSNV